MIARLREREKRKRRRRESRRHDERGVAAFERRQRVLEVGDGRQPVQPVRHARELAARGLLELGDVVEQQRRGAKHRRVHRAQKASRIAPEMRDLRRRPITASARSSGRASAAPARR